MAEALSTDKAEDGSNAIYTTYLNKPADIASALRTLRNQAAKIQLTFENDPARYSARILDVLDRELLLEDLQPRSGLRLMTARSRFALSGRASGVYLYSEANRASRIDEDRGVPYFRVPLPSTVLYQQRRCSVRYPVPQRTHGKPAVMILQRAVPGDKDHGNTLEGRMLDISAGGCRLVVPGPVHPPLASNEEIAKALIRIPGMYDLHPRAVIRHSTYNKLDRTVTCGVEFVSMNVTDRRRLTQFIQSLERAQG
ncbi:MAG TPA: PilZ domain-containing protein [Pseudomonadales bacterium]